MARASEQRVHPVAPRIRQGSLLERGSGQPEVCEPSTVLAAQTHARGAFGEQNERRVFQRPIVSNVYLARLRQLADGRFVSRLPRCMSELGSRLLARSTYPDFALPNATTESERADETNAKGDERRGRAGDSIERFGEHRGIRRDRRQACMSLGFELGGTSQDFHHRTEGAEFAEQRSVDDFAATQRAELAIAKAFLLLQAREQPCQTLKRCVTAVVRRETGEHLNVLAQGSSLGRAEMPGRERHVGGIEDRCRGRIRNVCEHVKNQIGPGAYGNFEAHVEASITE
jgi:hypothetical protein